MKCKRCLRPVAYEGAVFCGGACSAKHEAHEPMEGEEKKTYLHREKHWKLHDALDELTADMLKHEPLKNLSNTSILELMQWSYNQVVEPKELPQ